MSSSNTLPCARRVDELIVQELFDEILVYDRAKRKIHYLNPHTTVVWRHCDGRATIADVARVIESELGIKAGPRTVRRALNQLKRSQLI